MREAALTLLKVAVGLLPELGAFLAGLLVHAPPDHPLTDAVREILPLQGATDRALEALEEKKDPHADG